MGAISRVGMPQRKRHQVRRRRLSANGGRVDFVNSFLLTGRPYKLLLISTGNITSIELETLFLPQLTSICELLEVHHFVELNRTALVIHS